jgi:CRISPR-associated protein Csm4
MNVVAYRLRPSAPWVTPWHADSLFGALCWTLLRRRGEDSLRKMLAGFREGAPPFLLSDGCPGEWLPRPLVLLRNGGSAWRSHQWITRDDFLAARRGEVPSAPAQAPPEPFEIRRTRRFSSAGESGLFEAEEWTWSEAWPAEQRFVTVYARVLPEWVEPLARSFEALGQYGFGKRRTLGRGVFTVDRPPIVCDWLEPLRFEDGYISLNRFIPHQTDPVKGCWTVHVKYPKYGDEFSSGGQASKGRIVQLGPGSCFQFPGRPKRWYGTMLANLPNHPEALHYGLSLAIGMKWPQG